MNQHRHIDRRRIKRRAERLSEEHGAAQVRKNHTHEPAQSSGKECYNQTFAYDLKSDFATQTAESATDTDFRHTLPHTAVGHTAKIDGRHNKEYQIHYKALTT